MVTDAEKYGAKAEHDAVSTETSGARLDDEARDKLADAIEGSLAALGGDSVVTPSKQVDAGDQKVDDGDQKVTGDDDQKVDDGDQKVDDQTGDDDDDQDADGDDDQTGDDDQKVDDPAGDGEAVDDDAKKSSPTLPATYRRSLKAYGWEDDEIDAAMVDNAEQFTLTAMKIHRTRNDEISKFAEAGRRLRQGVEQDPNQPDPGKSVPAKFSSIDRDALVEKYGNEEIIDAILGPMQERIEALDAVMPQVQTAIATSERTQRDTLGRMIDTFFGDKEMAPYEGLYGKPGEARTPEQTEKYQNVLEQADAIIAGAAQQGRMITFDDAMESAHADISRGYTEKAVRSKIKTKVKKRAKSLSLKPSHGGKPKKSDGKPSTRKQLETKTQTALSKVFT